MDAINSENLTILEKLQLVNTSHIESFQENKKLFEYSPNWELKIWGLDAYQK